MVEEIQQIEIASNPENITQLEPFIDRLREEIGFDDSIYGNILICLTEAVNNAIIHGNQSNPSYHVILSCSRKPKSVVFKVKDQGAGFDFNNLPDPTDPENLEKLTGRGVFLMKELSDFLVYSNGGNTVEMEFKL